MMIPPDLHQKLHHHGQEHIIASWERLNLAERKALLEQLETIDLAQLKKLHEKDHGFALPKPEQIQPVPVIRLNQDREQANEVGTKALDNGEVAVLLVAGGQGSRLGFDLPKGMYPIGPVTKKTLFQFHGEKVLALRRRHKKPIPYLIMTSHATDTPTRDYFAEHDYFGLPKNEVFFFQQGTMPALDMGTGKLLFEAPGKLFSSPNGHGGTLTALADSGLRDQLRSMGIRHVFYFQVDNPLVKIADPVFLGHHIRASAEVSSKIIPKRAANEKLGHFVQVDGRCTILEYSDLPEALTQERDANGQLRLWAGSPAIHIFDIDFLGKVTQGNTRLPFHIARKKVPHIAESGEAIKPEKENALKFEMFIFDALPIADRWTVVECSRQEEFEPLKNATGPDSPETVARAISNLAGDWLDKAGVKVPRNAEGHAAVPLEISPTYALDASELAKKVDRGLKIEGPTHLS